MEYKAGELKKGDKVKDIAGKEMTVDRVDGIFLYVDGEGQPYVQDIGGKFKKVDKKNSIVTVGMKGKYRGKDIVVGSVEGNFVKILQGGEVELVEKEDLDQNTTWSQADNKNAIITPEDRRNKGQELFGTKA